MKKAYMYGQDAELLGPGTDLIIALLGVILMAVAINAELNDEEFKNQARIIEIQQEQISKQKEQIDELTEVILQKDEILAKNSLVIDRYNQETEYILNIRKQQLEIIHTIANSYKNSTLDSINKDNYHVFFGKKDATPDITIHNDISLQRISFGNHILFESDKSDLKFNGRKALSIAGKAIKSKIDYIEEILIQGHTDTDGERNHNLNLGSKRATSVFIFLVDSVEIDPYKNLMSSTSFGFYKPFNRRETDTNFSEERVEYANYGEERKSRNRRIDIVLNYRENI